MKLSTNRCVHKIRQLIFSGVMDSGTDIMIREFTDDLRESQTSMEVGIREKLRSRREID